MYLTPQYQDENLSNFKKATIFIVTVLSIICILLPQVLSNQKYGNRISHNELEQYPESGPGGRADPADYPYFYNIPKWILSPIEQTFMNYGDSIIPSLSVYNFFYHNYCASTIFLIIVFMSVYVFEYFYPDGPYKFRLNGAIIVSFIVFVISYLSYPLMFTPQRYLLYTIPVFVVILVHLGLFSCINSLKYHKTTNQIFLTGVFIAFFFVFGNRSNVPIGYTVNETMNKEFYDKLIDYTGEDSVIAGWPTGAINNVPYLSKRTILMSYETHEVIHKNYMDEMRNRFHALLKAYYASGISDLEDLISIYNVNYLIVYKNHYNGSPGTYFVPFDQIIKKFLTKKQNASFILSDPPKNSILFTHGDLVVVDLKQLKQSAEKSGE